MMPESGVPYVKVCGLARAEDVGVCLDLGVDFTGFIFAPGSPRKITPEQAAAMPRGRALRVGVFAGQGLAEVRRIMEVAELDMAQLHGNEDADFCRSLGAGRVIKVFWPERLSPSDLQNACGKFADSCALFLLDAGSSGGGSGRALAWEQLGEFAPARPWLLAGGIGPGNVAAALEACAPYALDCNSGVESAPGVKDHHKLAKLMAEVRLRKKRAAAENI